MTSPMYSSGVATSTDMIGSRSAGLALRRASLKAIEPAILNAISEESTSWYLPSVRIARTSTVGYPASTPASSDCWMPASTDGMYSFGHAAAGDLVDELVAAAGAGGLEVDRDLGELALAAGLLLVGVGVLGHRLGDRLAVGHLRLADGGVDLELAEHAVDDHLEVELAHAGDDGLAGVLVGADLEGRVLLGEG